MKLLPAFRKTDCRSNRVKNLKSQRKIGIQGVLRQNPLGERVKGGDSGIVQIRQGFAVKLFGVGSSGELVGSECAGGGRMASRNGRVGGVENCFLEFPADSGLKFCCSFFSECDGSDVLDFNTGSNQGEYPAYKCRGLAGACACLHEQRAVKIGFNGLAGCRVGGCSRVKDFSRAGIFSGHLQPPTSAALLVFIWLVSSAKLSG